MLLTEYIHSHEFRDPSTYASFYYPPEGPDTERKMSEAEEEAQSIVEEDAATIQEDLQQDYPDATVTGTVVGVTDEDVDKKLEKMAKQYNMEVEKIKELVKEQLDNVRTDIKMQKAVELIASKAKEVK